MIFVIEVTLQYTELLKPINEGVLHIVNQIDFVFYV